VSTLAALCNETGCYMIRSTAVLSGIFMFRW